MKRKTEKKNKKNLSNLFLDWQKSLGRIARREEAQRQVAGKSEESVKVSKGPKPRSLMERWEKEIHN